jgi:nucleotide-binding universal stress UspA family protein
MPSRSLSSAADTSPLDSKIRYERILVPHDGSEMSDKALKHAVYLSKISGTEIIILHVLERKSREKGQKSVTTKEEDDIRQR